MNADAKMGMGMPANMSMAMMKIQLDKKVVPARKVTFDVTNTSPPGMALKPGGNHSHPIERSPRQTASMALLIDITECLTKSLAISPTSLALNAG